MADLRPVNEKYLRERLAAAEAQPLKGGPQPPDNDNMEARVKALEEFAQGTRDRLTRIEAKLETFATREDLHKEIGAQTWRIVGAMITLGTLLSGVVFFIARNVK